MEYRALYRGGDVTDDWATIYRNSSSCHAFCVSVMQPSSLVSASIPNSWGADPYYVKCYNSSSGTPPNGIRVAFTSQINTAEMDPSLQQITPITNISACLRMQNYRKCYYFRKRFVGDFFSFSITITLIFFVITLF